MRIAFIFLLIASAFLAPSTKASADAQLSKQLRSYGVRALAGNTLIGVTNGGRIWSAYFAANKTLRFDYSDGTSRRGRWKMVSADRVCIHMPATAEPAVNVCKTIERAGQGFDWRTIGRTGASSQALFTVNGDRPADQASYSPNIRHWIGKTVIGRTLGKKNIWMAQLGSDGIVEFSFTSGRNTRGVYYVYGDTICFKYPDADDTHCRRPKISDGKIIWVNTEDGSYISEIVYLHDNAREAPIQERARTTALRSREAPRARGRCTARQRSDLKAACLVTSFGEFACATKLNNYTGSGAWGGASAAAVCNSAVQGIRTGDIDLEALGIATFLGAMDGAGASLMQEDDLVSKFLGFALRAGALSGTVSLANQCVKNVDRYCR